MMTLNTLCFRMTFWLVLLAAFLMWVMWICAFMQQIYPQVRPTVVKPNYKVKCFDDQMCLYVTQDICENKLDNYIYNPFATPPTCTPK